jgi:hypothetical protein
MRPDLDDILAGVQRLLLNDLVPALAEKPFLAEQAMYANLVLDYCRKTWSRAHVVLAEEHADLRATLAAVARQLGSGEDAEGLAAGIRRALDETRCEVATTTLDVVAAHNRTLRAEVSGAVAQLADAPASAARTMLDGYLERLAQRQHRELELMGILW